MCFVCHMNIEIALDPGKTKVTLWIKKVVSNDFVARFQKIFEWVIHSTFSFFLSRRRLGHSFHFLVFSLALKILEFLPLSRFFSFAQKFKEFIPLSRFFLSRRKFGNSFHFLIFSRQLIGQKKKYILRVLKSHRVTFRGHGIRPHVRKECLCGGCQWEKKNRRKFNGFPNFRGKEKN